MIGKIVKGKSFKGCISYAMGKDKAELIDSEGVLTIDKESIINSFYMQSLMNPNLAKSVGHIPLSYSKEDEPRLTDAFMVKLAKEYMQEMKIENTQFIIVRHHNTDNPHCHIVFNRVNNEGKTISDKNDRYLNEKVCKQLKDKYNLTYGKGKDQTNIQKLKGAEKTKYEIYKAIQASLYMAKDWQQMEYLLNIQHVSIAYKYKGQTSEIQGISFKKGDYSFKGSDIDRKFSYSKLNYQLGQKQEQNKEQQDKQQIHNNQNQTQQEESNVSDSLLNIATGAIQAHGDDWEEQRFKDRMDRKEEQRQFQSKKKKRKRNFGL